MFSDAIKGLFISPMLGQACAVFSIAINCKTFVTFICDYTMTIYISTQQNTLCVPLRANKHAQVKLPHKKHKHTLH